MESTYNYPLITLYTCEHRLKGTKHWSMAYATLDLAEKGSIEKQHRIADCGYEHRWSEYVLPKDWREKLYEVVQPQIGEEQVRKLATQICSDAAEYVTPTTTWMDQRSGLVWFYVYKN